MNPTKITTYKCTQCGREYNNYSQAEECCTSRDEIKSSLDKQAKDILNSIPKQILTEEDYVRTVIGIRKLDKFYYDFLRFDMTYYNITRKKKEECKDYLRNIVEELINKLDLELTKQVEIDGKIYVPFDAEDILSFYFDDYEDQDYDLTREKKSK